MPLSTEVQRSVVDSIRKHRELIGQILADPGLRSEIASILRSETTAHPDRAATPARPRVYGTSRVFIVSDLDRSLDFYCNALGFREPGKWGEPPCFAMANRDGFDIMLSLAQAPAQVQPNGPHGVWDFYIRVVDIEAEIAALKASSCEIVRGPEDAFYQMREIEVLDPDGYRICLAQDISA